MRSEYLLSKILFKCPHVVYIMKNSSRFMQILAAHKRKLESLLTHARRTHTYKASLNVGTGIIEILK